MVVYLYFVIKGISQRPVQIPLQEGGYRKVLRLNTGCHRRNGPNFGRVFLMLKYNDITQNTYIQS